MPFRSLSFFLVLLIVSQLSASGCNRSAGPKRYHISGTVTYQGKPVPFGDIMFVPDNSKGNSGPAGFAKIKDGKFDTSVDGKGMIGGAQEITINGSSVARPEGSDEAIPALFPQYQTQAELPQAKMTLDFEVPAEEKPSR